MYNQPPFKTPDPDHQLAMQLMREHPFAALASNGDDGLPYLTYLPLHLEGVQGSTPYPFKILGHFAKGNPHWKLLQQKPTALVSFMGPFAYMSPKVYPDLARVPTWNYLTVQLKVSATLIDEADAKDKLLKQLIGDHEPAYAKQWRGLEKDYQEKMLSAIVGFELQVVSLELKFKLNQHRPEAHSKMYDIYAAGSEAEQGLARWMHCLGLAQSG